MKSFLKIYERKPFFKAIILQIRKNLMWIQRLRVRVNKTKTFLYTDKELVQKWILLPKKTDSGVYIWLLRIFGKIYLCNKAEIIILKNIRDIHCSRWTFGVYLSSVHIYLASINNENILTYQQQKISVRRLINPLKGW